MTRMVPNEKMCKKTRKELAKKDRKFWLINPVTRVVPNKKVYKRNKNWKKEIF